MNVLKTRGFEWYPGAELMLTSPLEPINSWILRLARSVRARLEEPRFSPPKAKEFPLPNDDEDARSL